MNFIDKLAESHIREAIERGDCDKLEGAGRPLRLGDDTWVPEHLRAGYRLLKNAGFVPPELELRREIRSIESLLSVCEDRSGSLDAAARHSAGLRLSLLRARLEALRGDGQGLSLADEDRQAYGPRIARRLARRPKRD